MTALHRYKGGLWFRVLGYGLAIKDTRINPLLFSQRNGYKGKSIGRYHVTVLKPSDYKP